MVRAMTREWDLLSNHAHVLLCVACDPGVRLREIAESVGITERSAHKIVADLVKDGYVVRERQGRRNRYEVRRDAPLRRGLVREQPVGELLDLLLKTHRTQD